MKKGGLRRPHSLQKNYFFLLFFFLDDFALRFLAICFSLPSERKTFPAPSVDANAFTANEI